MIDEDTVRVALNTIIDPCSCVTGVTAGLEDMGLVRRIVMQAATNGLTDIQVSLRVTEPGCLMGVAFVRAAQDRLRALPGVGRVEVMLNRTYDWTPDDMSAAYRARLGALRST